MSTPTLPETTGAIAAQFKHPNQRYRHSREEAAQIIAEAINGPYSPETLRKSPTPYMIILGRAQYDDDDLFDRAEAILSRARKSGGPPAKNSRAA
jgi:hypothetical protein